VLKLSISSVRIGDGELLLCGQNFIDTVSFSDGEQTEGKENKP